MKETSYYFFIWIFISFTTSTAFADPYNDETYPERARCVNGDEDSMPAGEKNRNTGPYNLYQPRQRFDVYEKHTNPLETNKRSLEPYEDNPSIHKRQVGVVYGNGKPIGILQPYQESYKFIPVKDESSLNGIEKREAARQVGDYPSILANFKIQQASKVPQAKREYKQIKSEPKDMDKMRILRSSANTGASNQIEDKIKNLIEEMGIGESDDHEKREAEVEAKPQRQKRDESSSTTEDTLSSNPLKRDIETRAKREKEDNDKMGENFDDSIESNKASLASKSAIETRESENEDDSDYEKRMERQIKDRITALKAEVKRQIDKWKNQQQQDQSDEEGQRKKRQVNTLIDMETDFVDPIKDASENELKPLVRKRRTTKSDNDNDDTTKNGTMIQQLVPLIRVKRNTDNLVLNNDANINKEDNNMKKRRKRQNLIFKRTADFPQESDYQNSIFDDDAGMKRDIDLDYTERSRRSDLSDDYYAEAPDDIRAKREDMFLNDYDNENYREKRHVEEPMVQNVNKPQQLTDMSDVDLFGALPKNYDGELSRIKRIKRNKNKN